LLLDTDQATPTKRRRVESKDVKRKRKQAEWVANRRMSEEPSQSQKRHRADAAKTADTRSKEDDTQTKNRRKSNAVITANTRSKEGDTQTENRRRTDAAKTADTRSKEDDTQTENRRRSDAARTADTRSTEDDILSQTRRASNTSHMASQRSEKKLDEDRSIAAIEIAKELEALKIRGTSRKERRDACKPTVGKRRRFIPLTHFCAHCNMFLCRPLKKTSKSYRKFDIDLFVEEECEHFRGINNQIQLTFSIGAMDQTCDQCGAFHYLGESLSKSTKKRQFYGMCCLQGTIRLPAPSPPPEPLLSLYKGDSHPKLTEVFHRNIRRLNSNLAFASMSCNEQHLGAGGPPIFKIQGEVRHLISKSILPAHDTDAPKFISIYFHDTANELKNRLKYANDEDLYDKLLADLQQMMHRYNIFLAGLKAAFESLPPNATEMVIIIKAGSFDSLLFI